MNIGGRIAVRSIANVGRSALNSLNRSISNIGTRGKNLFKSKKKGKKKDEDAETLQQFMVMLEARSGAGYFIQPKKGLLGDSPRLNALYGKGIWIKMEWKRRVSGGKVIIVHWFKNTNNDLNVEYKFKRRK